MPDSRVGSLSPCRPLPITAFSFFLLEIRSHQLLKDVVSVALLLYGLNLQRFPQVACERRGYLNPDRLSLFLRLHRAIRTTLLSSCQEAMLTFFVPTSLKR